MVTHVSNEQLKRLIIADAAATLVAASQPKPAPLTEGLHNILGTEVSIQWERPPIPNATGWYWCREEGSLQGPFNTLEAAHDDAHATLLEDEA